VILLDTVVVAAALRRPLNEPLIAWFDAQPRETMFLTTISVGELLRDIDRLPVWKRETGRGTKLRDMLVEAFARNILPYDLQAAQSYATVMKLVRSQGFSISKRDCLTAAVAHSFNMAVATDDDQPFTKAGLRVAYPWGL